MKILFDNSIHLGQFSINDEPMRIAAKNSQVMISEKPQSEIIGIESFNENAYSDDIIWSIPREPQDVFYKFMDIYHSVKNVDRIPLYVDDAQKALEISKDFNINISNALTCAIALRVKVNEIHSFYKEFEKDNLLAFLNQSGIIAKNPSSEGESRFIENNLEQYYQDALEAFRKWKINLPDKFHI